MRENENAALDGRVEKLEQGEGMVADGISGLQARVNDISEHCKRVKEQARQLEEGMTRNTASKDELLKLQGVLDGKPIGLVSSGVFSVFLPFPLIPRCVLRGHSNERRGFARLPKSCRFGGTPPPAGNGWRG